MSFGNCTNLNSAAICPLAEKKGKNTDVIGVQEPQDTEQKNFEPWENIDQSIEKMLADAVSAHLANDKESARRSARMILRQVQKNKDHPQRALYLIIAKTIHAHCFDRSDRTKVLLAKIKKLQFSQENADQTAMVDGLQMLCQISFSPQS